MRTCDAVGVQEIYVLNTRTPRHEKWGFKSSSSAMKWLTVHQFENLDACLSCLREKHELVLTTHLQGQPTELYQVDFTRSMALVFGNEHEGVSEEFREKADGNFIIPQMGIIQSLNISVACAVTLYEALRQKKAAGHYNQPQLSEETMKAIKLDWGWKLDELDANH
jgi:tRNA (guanosine-2'-O-)-methyltransferase